MSKEKRRVPKLRFPGFTEDWEQCKLKSIANTIVAGGDIDKNKIKESGTYPVIANALTKDGVVGYYEDTYRIEAPAVTVTGRGDIGVAKARHQNFTPVVRLLSLTTAHDVDFIENAINNLKIVSESTGVAQLTVPQLSNYKIHITSILEERKIGLFISKVDNLITLHQRKLNNLKLKKKALFQKLFPKNGERYPELRFPGFTDAWEQRKFGEIMTFLNGRAYKQDELLEDGKYKVLRVGNFYTNDSWYYSDLELDDKYYAMNGDLLYTWSATFGPHIWKGEKVIYHYHIWKLVLQDKIDKLFALQLLEVDKANIMSDKNGSTMVHITKQGMENKQTILPISLNEQKQIAKFLSSMDKLITLHQRKLDHLQLQKKALLQQMFV